MSRAEALLIGSVIFFTIMVSVVVTGPKRNSVERDCEERGGVLVMTSKGPACAKLQLMT